jgi:AraC-like DNA-binding protein
MNAVTPSPLQPLPFGDATALRFDDLRSCIDWLGRLRQGPAQFGAIGQVEQFRIRFQGLELPGVGLFAGTSTALSIDHLSDRIGILVPFAGCATVADIGRTRFRWSTGHGCFLNPAGQRATAESTGGAYLRIDIAPEILASTMAEILGPLRRKAVDLQLDRARVVPLRFESTDWSAVVRSLCGTIDAYGGDVAALTAAGIDDVIRRTAAMMLRPVEALGGPPAIETRGFDLGPLVDQVMDRLHERITLSDLARWSERSIRTVQLAFHKRFGVSPLEWLRDQRLERLRARLLKAAEGESVASIARACGLPRLTAVVPDYVQLFGETPEQTLDRR